MSVTGNFLKLSDLPITGNGPITYHCPVCEAVLAKVGKPCLIRELLSMWEVPFTEETIAEQCVQGEETQLYSCPRCDLEVFFPQVIGTPAFYTELQGGPVPTYYVDDRWDFAEALRDCEKGGTIIEIGCGPGVFLERAGACGAEPYGVEYNERALAIAEKKGLKVFPVDSAEIAAMKGRFDSAYSFHVLEHVPDPVAFVKEMLSWVKPGGKIGISVPNMDGPVKFIDPCASNMPPHHATRWRLATLKALAVKLGLQIERVAYEPLPRGDHYYYSYYGFHHWFPGKSLPGRLLQRALSRSFGFLFNLLAVFDKKTIGLLRGQSMYVLLSKQADR